MGDYVALRGKVQIKPHFIDVFKRHLFPNAEGERLTWRDVGFEEHGVGLQSNSIFEQLSHPANEGADNLLLSNSCTNSFNESEESFEHRLTFSDSGELNFLCGAKYNHWDNHLLFVALLPVIADTWVVEHDRSQLMFGGRGAENDNGFGWMIEEEEKSEEENQISNGIYRFVNDTVSLSNQFVNERMITRYNVLSEFLFQETDEIMQLIIHELHDLEKGQSTWKFVKTSDLQQPTTDRFMKLFSAFGTTPKLGRVPSRIIFPTSALRPPVCIEQIKFFSQQVTVVFAGEACARTFELKDHKGIAKAIYDFIT